jgi:GTP pyrophosphokinase
LNGDQLEIITSSKQKPHDEWLRFVISARAKQKIKSSLNEERKAIAQDGKEILERKFKQHNIRLTAENITFLEKYFSMPSVTELYFRIAKGKIDLIKLRDIDTVHGILNGEKKTNNSIKDKHEKDVYPKINKSEDSIIIGEDFKNIQYQMAKCCNPIPGDLVFGFITISEGIKIHRNNCPNAEHLLSKMNYRCIKARWQSKDLVERVAAIQIMGIDNIGLVNRLTEIISKEHNVNMKSISFETEDGIFDGRIKVLVYDTDHLEQLMRKFEQVDGVQRVTRWDTEEDQNPQESL